jgi:hypothetical protein
MNAPIAGRELEGEPGSGAAEDDTQQFKVGDILARGAPTEEPGTADPATAGPGTADRASADSATEEPVAQDAAAGEAPFEEPPADELAAGPGQSPAEAPPSGTLQPNEAVAWVRQHWIVLVAVALILISLVEKGVVLAHAYFRQDDFYLFDWALKSPLSLHFLWTNYTGHLMPGSLALAWGLSRASLYDWTLASTVMLVLLAAASFALLRLLRTLFGTRPAILIPLTIYLFCMLGFTGLTFWSTMINWVPTQLAVFMAANAHFTYLRTKRFRHAAFAAAWIVFGLLFDEADVFIPFLLLALTSAFFVPGHWQKSVVATVRENWRTWALYLVIVLAYAGIFLNQLHTSTLAPAKPGPFSNVLTLGGTLVRLSFVPAALGGPWRWLSNGQIAYALQTPVLTAATWLIAPALIAVSLWFRRHAWRSWITLAAWICLTALAPLAVGRVSLGVNVGLLGTDMHYLADSLPVLAICLGLAFWPVAGESDAYRAPRPQRLRRIGTAAGLVAFLAGATYSYSALLSAVNDQPQSSYIATARVAMSQAPPGSVILSSPVPGNVQLTLYGQYSDTATLLGLMATPTEHLHWTTRPSGVVNLLTFDQYGRLWGVSLFRGQHLVPRKKLHGCWTVGTRTTRIPLGGHVFYWPWEISMTYSGPAATIAVEFGGTWHDYALPAGAHELWIPAPGAGDAVQAQLLSGGPSECISSLAISSTMQASLQTVPVPYLPVPG